MGVKQSFKWLLSIILYIILESNKKIYAFIGNLQVAEFNLTSRLQNQKLLVQCRHSKARLPTRGSLLAAGYDLYSCEKNIIPARSKAVVSTGISIHVPEGTYGRVAPRSGLAIRYFIDVGAGVIDTDYRGLVSVVLFNHGEKDFEVNEGDRIAQLVLECIVNPDVVEVESLENTERGTNGFGSTGIGITTSSHYKSIPQKQENE